MRFPANQLEIVPHRVLELLLHNLQAKIFLRLAFLNVDEVTILNFKIPSKFEYIFI